MASPILLSLVSASAILLLLSTTATAAVARFSVIGHAVAPILPNPCMRASFPSLCQGLLRAGGTATDMDVELAAIKALAQKINEAIAVADKSLKSLGKADKAHKARLDGCKKKYKEAIEDLDRARQFLEGAGTDAAVNRYLSSAMSNIDSCSTGWGGAGVTKDFPLGAISEVMSKMASNTLSLGSNLKDDTGDS